MRFFISLRVAFNQGFLIFFDIFVTSAKFLGSGMKWDTSDVAKYLDTAIVKLSNKFYKATLPADMIFTKEDVSTSDEQMEKLTREYNIHYRACIGSLIYLLSTSGSWF